MQRRVIRCPLMPSTSTSSSAGEIPPFRYVSGHAVDGGAVLVVLEP